MRTELAKWEGHRVLVKATVIIIEEGRYCLENVRVKQYCHNGEVKVLDHLWTYFDPEEQKGIEELGKISKKFLPQVGKEVGFIGEVIKYRRSNGSWDYAVDSIPTESFILHRTSSMTIKQWEAMTLRLYGELKRRMVFYNFETETYRDALNSVEQLLGRIRDELKVLALNEELVEKSMSFRKGDVKPDPIKFPSRELSTAQGFRG